MKTLNELPLLMDQNRARLKKKGQNIHKSVDFQYQELHIFPPITPHLLMYTAIGKRPHETLFSYVYVHAGMHWC